MDAFVNQSNANVCNISVVTLSFKFMATFFAKWRCVTLSNAEVFHCRIELLRRSLRQPFIALARVCLFVCFFFCHFFFRSHVLQH